MGSFKLQDLYEFETHLQIFYPNNFNIEAKIRRELQHLRDKYTEFFGGVANINKSELITQSKKATGKTFGELDNKSRISSGKTKGIFGHIIEESLFNYDINSSREPDFKEAGVELKVTAVKKLKKEGYSAKERLVLNIIDFNSEYKFDFYESSFWKKNQSLLLMFYLYEPDKSFKDYTILNSILYEYPDEDLPIIKKDREIIINKILNGNAESLSERDTMYLGACPKGSSKKSVTDQPFSNIKAMKRAYAFKSGYMTQIIRKYVMGKDENEKIIKDSKILTTQTFDDYVLSEINKNIGDSLDTLIEKFGLESNSKNINAQIISRILGVKNIRKSDEFLKANIKIKTIQKKDTGTIKESMSFPAFKYQEIVQESWEDSQLREMFLTTKWLFVIFTKTKKEIILERAFFWSMPDKILENDIKLLWIDTVHKIQLGKIYNYTNSRGQRITHFLGSSETEVAHVRPHGLNKDDTYPLPVLDQKLGVNEYTKSCFWLNSKYIKTIVENN